MRIVSFFLIVLLFFSCERKQEKKDEFEEYKGIQLTESFSKSLGGNISYTLELPDTLKVNQAYQAIFKFDSPFDTILDPMVSDSIKFRTIKLSYYKPIKIETEILKEDIVLKDSVYIPNKLFTLGNIRFKEKGKYLFLVLIEDEIMYNYYNKHGKRDSVHLDRIFEEIKKEVVVIE
ncbi:hypothetical protein M2306_000592 [Myroides gitamensis]|uniref:Lipoprotein n=1 Tax=Myroides odoratus TaxID=256 RepID=A0A378RNK9_MYROD|nr:hypothetical protein [Myroides odoratus]MCS4237831.1 hypothetical protein [Myroides odoratus]MDH6599898.1 hypothetical protein [Myroides gitamensis]QQU04623.1 hypothetical protein I6I89_04865 [Myroides odoratus]STZ27939.1 Uncharacterised protein [Myroides odoratus]